jgi:hypothetical protein
MLGTHERGEACWIRKQARQSGLSYLNQMERSRGDMSYITTVQVESTCSWIWLWHCVIKTPLSGTATFRGLLLGVENGLSRTLSAAPSGSVFLSCSWLHEGFIKKPRHAKFSRLLDLTRGNLVEGACRKRLKLPTRAVQPSHYFGWKRNWLAVRRKNWSMVLKQNSSTTKTITIARLLVLVRSLSFSSRNVTVLGFSLHQGQKFDKEWERISKVT